MHLSLQLFRINLLVMATAAFVIVIVNLGSFVATIVNLDLFIIIIVVIVKVMLKD